MLIPFLCLFIFINQGIEETTACQSTHSIAYMCQNNTVQGSGVTIDVSTAATSGYSTCTCTVHANVTGFVLNFDDNPNVTDCGAQLDIEFDDLSMQLKCGIPKQGQPTTGRLANIRYTRSQDVADVSSDYCLSFHSNKSGVEFTLTCFVGYSTTTTTTSGSSVQTTTGISSNATSVASSSTTAVQSSTPTSSTTVTASTVQASTPTSSTNATASTVQASTPTSSTNATASTVQASNASETSTFSDLSTTTASVTSTTPFVAGSTTPDLSTALSTIVNTTVPNTNNTYTTLVTTDDHTTKTSLENITSATTSDTSTTLNSSLTTTVSITQTSLMLNTTSVNLDNTTSVSTQPTTLSYNVTSSTYTTKSTQTATLTTNITHTTETHTTGTTSNTPKPISTQSTEYNTTTMGINTTQPVENTTISTPLFNNNTMESNTTDVITTVDPFLLNLTTTDSYGNNTMDNNTTDSINTTADPALSNITTTMPYENNTMENNTTDMANTTADPNISNITTTINYDNNTMENSTTVNTTSDPLLTTDLYNGTTISNTTNDYNDTVTSNVTGKPEKTTQGGFWEPPYMDYDVPERPKNSIIVILVPIAGVLLVVFIAVVVYIMCKRSRDAKRKTMIPNSRNKSNTNANTTLNNNTAKPEKPQNPTDMFTTQSVGKYPTKYNTENEVALNGTKKSNFMDETKEDKLLREQFENTLNSSLTSEKSKPRNYEPSEREKDLLSHLELSSIVIESDPNDSNRYFKKDDPGDWYRVIMKGKKPRDPNSKDKRSRKKKSKSSGSEDNAGESRHRRRKHRDKKQRSRSLDNSSKRRSKNRHSSTDSFDNTLNGDETDLKASLQSRQPRMVVSKPADKRDSMHNAVPVTKQPHQVFSAPVNITEKKPEPVQTRVILSKPNSNTVPSPNLGNKPKAPVMQINSKPGNQENDNQSDRKFSVSSSSSGSFSQTNSQRNTPLRSSQTRNNLFGSGAKLNSTKENESSSKVEVKRPDIVPPLNLTQTGDQVGRTEDGFEEFLLSEC